MLCKVDDLAEGKSREFNWEDSGYVAHGFVIRWHGQVHAYRNRCPHTGAPLNWFPEQFLSHDGKYLMCSLHGALFEIEDGRCIYGPCSGHALDVLPVAIRQGGLYLLK